MSTLLPFAAEASQWLAPLVGTSVFGVTASLGGLLTEPGKRRPRRKSQPSTAPLDELVESELRSMRRGDRREVFRRYGTPVRVVLADTQRREIGSGWVVDRSAGGLGLHVEEPLPQWTVLNLRPASSPGIKPWVSGLVKHCEDLDEDYWKIGCQFLHVPPWGVLALFG